MRLQERTPIKGERPTKQSVDPWRCKIDSRTDWVRWQRRLQFDSGLAVRPTDGLGQKAEEVPGRGTKTYHLALRRRT